MNLRIYIVLFLFMSFLVAPTVLSVIDTDTDVSCFYNMAEEEENHISLKEVKTVPALFSIPDCLKFILFQKNNFNIFLDLNRDSLSANIFLPPPEFI